MEVSTTSKKAVLLLNLVLSLFDLTVVTITHPFLIASTIDYYLEELNEIRQVTRQSIFFILYGVSMFALFTLNVERFLALICPYFHQASVTKTRLVYFQALLVIITVGLSPSVYFNMSKLANSVVALSLLLMLFLFICSYYKLYTIAMSKRVNRRVAPMTAASSTDGRLQKQILNLKNVSTCSFGGWLFFGLFLPSDYIFSFTFNIRKAVLR